MLVLGSNYRNWQTHRVPKTLGAFDLNQEFKLSLLLDLTLSKICLIIPTQKINADFHPQNHHQQKTYRHLGKWGQQERKRTLM